MALIPEVTQELESRVLEGILKGILVDKDEKHKICREDFVEKNFFSFFSLFFLLKTWLQTSLTSF